MSIRAVMALAALAIVVACAPRTQPEVAPPVVTEPAPGGKWGK